MSGPISPVSSSPQPPLGSSSEPLSTEPQAPEALMCRAPAPAETQPDPGAGAELLVRRYAGGQGGAEGAGGAPATEPGDASEARGCGSEMLLAAASCGNAIVAASMTGGLAAVFPGVHCLVSAGKFIECVQADGAR